MGETEGNSPDNKRDTVLRNKGKQSGQGERHSPAKHRETVRTWRETQSGQTEETVGTRRGHSKEK